MSPKTPTPSKSTDKRKEEKEKILEDEKEESSSGQQRSIDPALKTRQSHTVEHDVTKIIP